MQRGEIETLLKEVEHEKTPLALDEHGAGVGHIDYLLWVLIFKPGGFNFEVERLIK